MSRKRPRGTPVTAISAPASAVSDPIDVPFEEVGMPVTGVAGETLKINGFFGSQGLHLADGILAAVALAGVFDISAHKAGTAAWIALLGFALRSKFILAERLPLAWPEWIAYALPSIVVWSMLYLVT